ncbi:DUF1652 domain-containing protein [Pseudomonas sp. 10B1]|uniref:DUF1652 domain-containing protein n=1 Tax=unclassified Pseudomonas TaxID=196821 RepID=UPI002AB4E265|nr:MULTISPECIES: DUF1652 domain-containing protein [unclassified Pseudomonas]MDY7560973.1 DUF1652 domain-containing protein [Pseudomonas sp. AB6]MEA9978303.1 DUF1652 domain-containing protein [Pseudomonas sp. RTS4]MEA9995099.1 DUF1652 domain-containing protein [Pseudomonas sp. AA4]MEB0086948.1 DUF1652 domain-containing protein [Pseudomonas sp. RTI1]MEB0126785.1 DUF1652 domain-containing protein [Pseudomonas sp. CCC1.2]
MIAYRLSTLELRGIIERAFLPLRCICTVAPDYSMTVQISDADSERVDLCVTGISLNRLNTSRDISDLVAELRYDLANNVGLRGEVHAKAG